MSSIIGLHVHAHLYMQTCMCMDRVEDSDKDDISVRLSLHALTVQSFTCLLHGSTSHEQQDGLLYFHVRPSPSSTLINSSPSACLTDVPCHEYIKVWGR